MWTWLRNRSSREYTSTVCRHSSSVINCSIFAQPNSLNSFEIAFQSYCVTRRSFKLTANVARAALATFMYASEVGRRCKNPALFGFLLDADYFPFHRILQSKRQPD